MICKDCKYFHRKIVIQPKGYGMCENGNDRYSDEWNDRHNLNWKRVLPSTFECDKGKRGQYHKISKVSTPNPLINKNNLKEKLHIVNEKLRSLQMIPLN